MRAELPHSDRDMSLVAPAAALLISTRAIDAAATIDLVPDAPLFAQLTAETARTLPAQTLAADLRPADFGPMLAVGAATSAPDLVPLALAVLIHASACLGLLQFATGGARVETGFDEEPIEVVMDTAAGASVVEPERSALETPAPSAEAPAKADAAPRADRDMTTPETARADAPAAAMAALSAQPAAKTPEAERLVQAPDAEPMREAPAPRLQAREQAQEQAHALEKAQAEERRKRQMQARLAAERAEARETQRLEKERARARSEAQQRERERRQSARAALDANRGETQAAQPRGGAASSRTAALRETEAAGGGFDAASYRAIIARAVKAAVGSKCSFGAGSRVVIALTIGRSGAIGSVGIASSSGNGAFDAASLSAVRSAGPFPPPTGRSSVSVPVGVSCR